ncbi:gluconokinase [Actinomadura craniellae]|uniref:Gluconokinase n=2 Tax=Actinomadura craniellae TaxID=2231787 RepID=A0A365HAQ7_9ACTN|nr:gluconokinase [Actinomadura craniellae]
MVMGVSGSGKTTIGKGLAERLGWEYADADEFHPRANVLKMEAGTPLTDADRMPWLAAIGDWMDARLAAGTRAVVSCSALKRAYRDLLAKGRPDVRIVHLDGDRALIQRRITARHGHFFPPSMLDSQFRDLEPPEPDENVVSVPITGTPEETVEAALAGLAG